MYVQAMLQEEREKADELREDHKSERETNVYLKKNLKLQEEVSLGLMHALKTREAIFKTAEASMVRMEGAVEGYKQGLEHSYQAFEALQTENNECGAPWSSSKDP
jgi:hypothetical protein